MHRSIVARRETASSGGTGGSTTTLIDWLARRVGSEGVLPDTMAARDDDREERAAEAAREV